MLGLDIEIVKITMYVLMYKHYMFYDITINITNSNHRLKNPDKVHYHLWPLTQYPYHQLQ